ncbi:MAG: ribose-phosphate pyrophosphokinase-like domain-containing protein, partial [Mogibacterium sp.]|nr:ribose-phosphate pyrophosphokinase-like domain-containing protein [Mogibacterium sp.]
MASEDFSNIKVFCGNSIPTLAAEIAKKMGVKLGNATVKKFSDG